MCNNTRMQRNAYIKKNTSDDYINNHTYAQCTNTDYNNNYAHTTHKFRSDGEKDEFLKHF